MELADLQFCEYLARNEDKIGTRYAIKEILDWVNYHPGTVKLPLNYVIPKVTHIIPPNGRDKITDHFYNSIQEVMHAFKKEHNQLAIQKLADLVGYQIDE